MLLQFGEYICTAMSGWTESPNNVSACAIQDVYGGSGQSMPPVIITVDYGDGSGEQKWTRDDPRDMWSHKYQLPGKYWVHVSSKKIFCEYIY